MLSLIGQLGITMLVPIVGCTLFGGWLGRRYDLPVMAVGFFAVGSIAGFTGAYKLVRGYLKNPKSPGQLAREAEEQVKKKENGCTEKTQ